MVNKENPVIPLTLDPSTEFLPLMHCANYFCIEMNQAIMKKYFDNYAVPIDNSILDNWEASSIEHVKSFAVKELAKRQRVIFMYIVDRIRGVASNMKRIHSGRDR